MREWQQKTHEFSMTYGGNEPAWILTLSGHGKKYQKVKQLIREKKL